ncbi:MAG TPA: 4-oxalocrotonate tautomerase family protein [Candidatus Melainabacteria bacterium]|nr:4-oxalocrotonate tautomerase family protein [Candidatus Melainabacteria bacterium]
MPFVNVKLLESGATREQKAQIIEEITGTLQRVLNKNPENTHVVIEEINPDNWGNRGMLMSELRKETAKK